MAGGRRADGGEEAEIIAALHLPAISAKGYAPRAFSFW